MKGFLVLSYLKLIYRFKKSSGIKKVSNDSCAYYYLSERYKNFLDNLPRYKEDNYWENIIWRCRLQWEDNAPKLNKSCLASIREYAKTKKIVIITNDNINDYVKFPEYIMEKYNKGIISKTHFSDILRCELLIKYWWTRVDSTVLLTDYNKDFFDTDFFVFKNNDEYIALSSWFITSNKNNPILLTTRELLYEYRRTNDYLIHYFLFHLFFTLSTKKYPNIWNKVLKYSNIPPHVMQHEFLDEFNDKRFTELKNISSIHKLNHKIEREKIKKNSLFAYIENL